MEYANAHGKAWSSFEKLGEPVNKFMHKVGSEAFWPTALELESEKAARILKAFCQDGIYTEPQQPLSNALNSQQAVLPPNGPSPPRVLMKIPSPVIHNALGLAIVTLARAGAWGASLACGSGVLVARKEDNTWSSPSGIIVNTLGLGFTAGVDVYDCVLVINTFEALEKFKGMRISIGGDVSVTAGPWGAGRKAEVGLGGKKFIGSPIYSYIKSRGLCAGVQLDGTVMGVRSDENARFYGQRVGVEGILRGEVGRWTFLESVLCDVEGDQRMRREGKAFPLIMEFGDRRRIMEFDDRRGQTKGADGIWRDNNMLLLKNSHTNFYDAPEEKPLISRDIKSKALEDPDEERPPMPARPGKKEKAQWKEGEDIHYPDIKIDRVDKKDDGEWEDERRFYDLNTKKSTNDDGEWEDERLFYVNEPAKKQDDGEWEDERLFDALEKKQEGGAWEKREHFA